MPGPPAATWGDLVVGVDLHIVMVPSPGGPVPMPNIEDTLRVFGKAITSSLT